MGDWLIRDTDRGNEREADSRSDAEETKNDLVSLGANPKDIEIVPPGETDGGEVEPVDAEVIDHSPEGDNAMPDELAKSPIDFLTNVNADFVNTIKGTPAISKQGFRFQREFEITTQSEVVQWIDDPLGCVVWARAELPSGYAAEAHGEGWQFEEDMSDKEFVRYADTRAKNRALSDLTSAGALAVEELQGDAE